MPWVTIIESTGSTVHVEGAKTFNMPAVPRVGDSIRVGELPTSPVYLVAGVVWEVVPDMATTDFNLADAPAVMLYVTTPGTR